MGGASAVRLASMLLCSAALAAGCFSDRGLAIEVDVGDTGASSVELFLGKSACGGNDAAGIDCKAIAPPPTGSVPLRGDVWFRDDLALDTAQVKGHTATFQLRSDTVAAIPIVIAIGLDAGGDPVATATLHDVTIPINSARVVTATLIAARPVQPGTVVARNVTEDRVMVWSKTTPPSACVVVEHWESGTPTRSFIVPREDPDCDDVISECNPAAWHGMAAAGAAARPDCFTKQQTSACVLGSRACSDVGGPQIGECAPQHDTMVCVPDRFCDCTGLDEGCLRGFLETTPPPIPYIDCDLPMAMLNVCPDKASAAISLDGHFPRSQTCEQPLITSLALASFATSSVFDGAKIELTSPQSACNFSLVWKSGSRTRPIDAIDYGAIKVPTSMGAVVIPIALRFHPITVDLCGNATIRCELKDMPDSLWSCAL